MAEEETKTEEEITETEETQAPTETATTEPTETEQLRKQVEELQSSNSELQGRFDSLSQDNSRTREYLDQITPYVDFDGMKTARQGGETGSPEGDDQTFLTKADAEALEKKLTQRLATAEFERQFRVDYPDLGDKGPKEEMVRYFFERKTLKTDSFDKRLESAVKSARALLKEEQDKALKEKKAADEKAAEETRKKEEAAAKASGLSAGTITSPQKSEKESVTTSDYVSERREQQEKLKSG